MELDKVRAAEEFHRQFRKKANDISQFIVKPGTDLDMLATLRQELRQLEMEVIDAQLYLPAYDQKRYIQEIKDISDQLASRQVQLKPKTKFQFKRPAAAAAAVQKSEDKPLKSSDSLQQSMESVPIANDLSFAAAAQSNAHQQKGAMIRSVRDTVFHFQPPQGEERHVEAIDLSIEDCSHCIIDLLQHSSPISAIHIARLTRCIVIAKPILGSIMISDCSECIFVVACHQFRMHSSRLIDNYLHITSHPIIEDCSQVQFGPLLPQWYGEELAQSLGGAEGNLFDKVDDFNWLKKSKSPNWRLMADDRNADFLTSGDLRELLASDAFPNSLDSRLLFFKLQNRVLQ